jgi:hypothetical protein
MLVAVLSRIVGFVGVELQRSIPVSYRDIPLLIACGHVTRPWSRAEQLDDLLS